MRLGSGMGTLRVDVYPFHDHAEEGGRYLWTDYSRPITTSQQRVFALQRDDVFPIGRCNFLGLRVNCPRRAAVVTMESLS